jgi:hypothetical protein
MGQGDLREQDNAGHRFWVARYGRYAIRIDATRRGVYPWLITLEGRCGPIRRARPGTVGVDDADAA